MVLCWSCSAPDAAWSTAHQRGFFCDAGCCGRYLLDRCIPTRASTLIHLINLDRWRATGRREPLCVRPHPSMLARFGGTLRDEEYRARTPPAAEDVGSRPWLRDAEDILRPFFQFSQCTASAPPPPPPPEDSPFAAALSASTAPGTSCTA